MAAGATFTTNLCGCMEDCGGCIYALCCPVCATAKNKADVDGRDCTCCDCLFAHCFLEYFIRQQIRSKYGFEQAPCADCLVVAFCTPCTICQDAREIQAQEAKKAAPAMAAPGQAAMYR
eukprot:TRINITY_DN216_c0_g1_i1.p3 TRINITY_DN216_c0_g1~~TRINITY_DN216_c0_g1_i1.p3  ORF type:complete len:119 (+),score=28.19 TRINITY_DN216_c0_g1_i1:32-388(+)